MRHCQLLVVVCTLLLCAAETLASEITVQRGDSLYQLVRLHYPDQANGWEAIARQILELNPEAFVRGDPATLKVGAILTLPGTGSEQASSPAEEQPGEPPTSTPLQPLATVGRVVAIDGAPIAIDINNDQRQLGLNQPVYRGDALLSDAGGSLQLRMNDGAELFVRPYSRVVINDYTFLENEANGSRSILSLLKGGLRLITGLIGQRNPQAIGVQTPVATIGVRGTDFGLLICSAADCVLPDQQTLSAGTYTGVLAGSIALGNEAGVFPVVRGEVVRTASRGAAPELAPEAAVLVFTEAELALLRPQQEKPMNLLQWLRQWIFGDD